MTGIDVDKMGPVDYLVVEFPADKADFSGEIASELKKLTDSGVVRVLDMLLITKDADGSFEAAELHETDDSDVGQLREVEADLALLLAEDDVAEIAEVMEPGSVAAVLVWENAFAGPFGSAVRRGGQLVATGHIPTQALLAALEAKQEAASEGA